MFVYEALYMCCICDKRLSASQRPHVAGATKQARGLIERF